jgi:peptide/nickel transport system ATP-binding protein
VVGRYPNQFSGGELQRISVARAMIPRPELIVADEPVSMIDASMRMNVVNLFKKLRDDFKVTILYITHDLSTAYYVSDQIAIMYRGSIVESGPSAKVRKPPPTRTPNSCSIQLPKLAKNGTRWYVCPIWRPKNTDTKAANLQGAAPMHARSADKPDPRSSHWTSRARSTASNR